jgi:outer membrane protein assembly factor BamB
MNRFRMLLAGLLVAAAARPVAAGDWPHWRGPNRNGVVAERSGWEGGAWPAKAAWSARAGTGATSPLIAGGRLYTLGWAEERDTVYCLDAATGQELWKVSYPSPQYGRQAVGDQQFYGGPSATPEFDAETGYLYTLSIDGDLHCWDTRAAGRQVWNLNLYERFAVGRRPQSTPRLNTQKDYGYTAAPLVHGDWLLVEVGSSEGNLVAFDKRTGERRWASENRNPAGHAGGLAPITVEGVPCVAVFTLYGLLVTRLDPGNAGKTVAEHEWRTDFSNNIAGPTVHEDCVLLTSNYNHRTMVKLRIRLQGAAVVWEKPRSSGVCNPVVYRGHVYWASRGLICLDWETGEVRWEGGRFGDAASCVVTGDGRIIVWGNAGDLALAESAQQSPDEYRELAFLPVFTETEAWPHVAVAEGRVYVKDRAGSLRCFLLYPAAGGQTLPPPARAE